MVCVTKTNEEVFSCVKGCTMLLEVVLCLIATGIFLLAICWFLLGPKPAKVVEKKNPAKAPLDEKSRVKLRPRDLIDFEGEWCPDCKREIFSSNGGVCLFCSEQPLSPIGKCPSCGEIWNVSKDVGCPYCSRPKD